MSIYAHDTFRSGRSFALSEALTIGAALASMTLGVPAAFAASTPTQVSVHLQDATDDPSMAGMKMVIDHDHIPAGAVTFVVGNDSKSIVHEMLVIKVENAAANLPYDEKTSRVIESKLNKVVDSDDIKPGKTKKLKANLKAGNYILICNEPGHFRAAMRASLTVTE